MGIVKSVDSRGAATIHVSELGSSYDKVVPLNTTNLNRVAVGDFVKCTFSDEFFTELIVLGVANIKEVPAVEAFEYKVGDTGPGGGIIFFVDRFDEYPGFTYLEAAPVSAHDTRTWAPAGSPSYTSVLARGLGAGYQNTLDIVARGPTDAATSAVKYCADLTSGGQSDWYLPSLSEMTMVYHAVHLDLGVAGFDGVGTYWTSTELAGTQVWVFGFQFGIPQGQNKSTVYRVCPVRRF